MKAFFKDLVYGLACFNIASGYTDNYSAVETLARDYSDNKQ